MDLNYLPGLGPKRVSALKKSGLSTVADLLYNIPRTWLDQTQVASIGTSRVGDKVVLVGRVLRCGLVRSRTTRFIAYFSDGTGEIQILFFKATSYWSKKISAGSRYVLVGTLGEFGRTLQMVHPEIQAIEENDEYHGGIVPVYSISEACHEAKMEQKFFRLLYANLFKSQNLSIPRICPRELTDFLEMPSVIEILRRLHCPRSMGDVYQGRKCLKVLELLPFCLRMIKRRRALLYRGSERKLIKQNVFKAIQDLPYSLTDGQGKALNEILEGLSGKRQFHALLQGDVGSGKTVVAMLSMLAICGTGEQCALMVPTDILARQHFQTMQGVFEKLGLHVSLLLGAMTTQERRSVLYDLETGHIDAVIGTHALFSKDVVFNNLGFVIIDEQHRFGVNQREALLAKGRYPDLLVMSATPIPRSLAMTLYGDLRTIVISEKPAGRKPVKTRMTPLFKREAMKEFLKKEIASGNRCYWVVSRVESDAEGMVGVSDVVEELKAFSSEWNVQGVHGQMDEKKRSAILDDFASGQVQVLVATTVIEVGVNVPEANLMVIEHPERFGLAQLHQLRGRVGRGAGEAWCFLLSSPEDSAYERLSQFAKTEDGFKIAEMDLETRGAGNLEGGEQSGSWVFRWFDWIKDKELIAKTLEQAERILDSSESFSPEVREKIQMWYEELPPGFQDGIH